MERVRRADCPMNDHIVGFTFQVVLTIRDYVCPSLEVWMR